MSRTGKRPVVPPKGVTATIEGKTVKVKGPKGELELTVVDDVTVALEDGALAVKPKDDSKRARSMWGMTRSLLANMVEGVSEGFEENLELVGVGYRAQMQGTAVKLTLGLSHDVIYTPPAGVRLETGKPTELKISGIDKQAVGQAAAEIRRFRPPEPYKGKGVKYAGEQLRRKEGKKK